MKKRILCLCLLLAMLFSYGPLSHAETAPAALSGDGVNIQSTNSFGALLGAELARQQEAEAAGLDNVVGLTLSGNTATAEYCVREDAILIVGIYSEDGAQLLASGSAPVSAGEGEVTLTVTGDIPQYFMASAYLVDSYDYSPLCSPYSTPMYTLAMQSLLASTADDYEDDRVLRLGDDKETNFAVYTRDTILVREQSGKNTVVSADDETYTYVIENADETFTGLQSGDVVSYEYGDGNLLITKVDSVSVSGTTVTIHGAELALEEVFSHMKVEDTGSGADVTVDESTGDEGVTYTGKVSPEAPDTRGNPGSAGSASVEDELSADLGLGFVVDKSYSHGKITGSLTVNFKAKIYFYLTEDHQYMELTYDTLTKLYLRSTAVMNIPLLSLPEFGFAPVPGLFIGFEPEVVLRFTGKAEFEATISSASGFSYDNIYGKKNLSQAPALTYSVDVSGEIFFGIDFAPKVEILGGEILRVKMKALVGVELKGAMTGQNHEDLVFWQEQTAPMKHSCYECIDFDVYVKIDLRVKVEFLEIPSLAITLKIAEKTHFLGDYYYSLDNDELGKGDCPYKLYRVCVQVMGEDGYGISAAKVQIKNREGGFGYTPDPTDGDGVTSIYLPAGKYQFNASLGQRQGSANANVSAARRVVVLAYGEETLLPGFISGAVDTESVTDTSAKKEVVASGDCSLVKGQVTWTLYSDGLLSIQGSGAMREFGYSSSNKAPWDAASVKRVVIGQGVTRIGDFAFNGCKNMTSIVIPEGVTNIGVSAFGFCENLTAIVLPQSVTAIEDSAFAACKKLVDITIPAKVSSIGSTVFTSCYSLEAIYVAEDNRYYWADEKGVLFDKNQMTLLRCPCQFSGQYQIPETVTVLDDYAFEHCNGLTGVSIPAGVYSIGPYAFGWCSALEAVALPEKLRTIGESAFCGCEKITEMVIPNNVTTLDYGAFDGCDSLKSITLPANIRKISGSLLNSCYNLTQVTIPANVTLIEESAFSGCSGLQSVTIPASVNTIEDMAFFGCEKLTDVYFGGSESSWEDVEIGYLNKPLENAAIHYNSSGSSEAGAAEVLETVADDTAALEDVEVSLEQPKYEAVYGGEYASEEKDTYTLKTASFKGLVPEEEYLLLSLMSLEAEDLLAAENLLYVAQGTAAADGTLAFTYVQRVPTDVAYVIACGASNRNLKDGAITFPQMQEADEPKSVAPTVVYDGVQLVEGRDYELLGQVDYMEAGEYTCYIRGIHNYTGLVECTYQVEEAIEKFNIAFANMTLGNSLAMNFAFEQGHRDDWTGCYAKIVKTYADGRANKEITIPYADWGSAGIGGVAHFALKFDGVAAKEMSDSVFVTIYDGNGNAISNTWEDSVRGYAMRTLNNPKTSRESAIMVVDLLNYGAAAQEYFKYNQADLANNQMSEAQKALATQDAPAEDIRVKGPNYLGSNLGLESQILMRMAFKGTDTSMYATIEFTNHAGREIKVELEGSEFGATGAITIDEIVIADGRKPVTVTIYNADGSVYASATDSMESYIARMRVDKYDPLFEAILKFSDSAYNFFH